MTVLDVSTPKSTSVDLQPGVYQIEVWGAQGYTSDNPGGKGGYSSGRIYFSQKVTVYVNVGGQGDSIFEDYFDVIVDGGGFNGGGDGRAGDRNGGGGGGGASDVRLFSNNIYNRIIVAGGGGGSTSNWKGKGGDGGWPNGSDGLQDNAAAGIAQGGKQDAGGISGYGGNDGSFGYGGNASSNVNPVVGGGGGGWYGGASGGQGSSGAGGSGYILTKERTNLPPKYSPLIDSTYYFTPISMSTGVNEGNGRVLITQIMRTAKQTNIATPVQTKGRTPETSHKQTPVQSISMTKNLVHTYFQHQHRLPVGQFLCLFVMSIV